MLDGSTTHGTACAASWAQRGVPGTYFVFGFLGLVFFGFGVVPVGAVGCVVVMDQGSRHGP